MKPLNNTARWWLLENGYEDIAALIDGIMEKWKKSGKKTRRNWWDILAGGKNGTPRTIEGIEIPVIKAAQQRKGLAVTRNALKRNRKEKQAPGIIDNGRWPVD